MENCIVIVFMVGIFAGNVWTYPDQVPATDMVCKTMVPGHGPQPQKSAAPFKLEVSSSNIGKGGNVQVFLKGEADFKGFYVQARSDDGEPIGTFSPTDANTKVHNCGSGNNNAIFHGTKGTRNNVAVSWKSPNDFAGNVNFLATFVKDFDNFWTQVGSGSVSVA